MAKSNSKVALVTGAANGIGRAIARQLLDDGWRLGVVDIAKTELMRAFAKAARRAEVIAADISRETSAIQAVAATVKRFGRLDAVVSNAGIMHRVPLTKHRLDDWLRVINTNLTAFYLLARAAEKPLRKTKGALITIASTRALMSEPDTESYSASKGGLIALTHSLAVSLAPDVRVNCVSPGWIETETKKHLKPCKIDHAQHPSGRVGKPEDVAQLVAYLLDGERSGFITGANFVVDGGMTRKMIYAE